MKILVLQHVACEPPGTYTPFLVKRGEVVTVALDRDGAGALGTLDLGELAAVVAMGGPMGVYEADQHPWIPVEVDFIAAVVAAGIPVLGVCLGAQLLAAALGGEVFRGPRPEVGIEVVRLGPRAGGDPVLGGLPAEFPVLQWHSDTFTLPDGALLLASSDAYRHQAFCVGSAYGLQFHAETDWDLASQWLALPEYRLALEEALGPDGPDRLGRDLRAGGPGLNATADHIIQGWLTTFVDPRWP
jgi:GMP synthase (glutamine-hydrolysing)